MQSMNHKPADILNGLLRGEMSAVETYDQALNKIDDPSLRADLSSAQHCHAGRVQELERQIVSFGGEPSRSSGAWGAFAKTVEGGATLLGDKAAISMLEEGEDKGLKDYRDKIQDVTPEVRPVIEMLLERQEFTHRIMSDLKQRLQ